MRIGCLTGVTCSTLLEVSMPTSISSVKLICDAAYEIASKPLKAMAAYEKAHAWQPLFTLAAQQDLTPENLKTMAYRVGGGCSIVFCVSFIKNDSNVRFLEELCTRKRWVDGARVYLDYATDVPEAVRALCNGNELDEALRIVSLGKPMYLR